MLMVVDDPINKSTSQQSTEIATAVFQKSMIKKKVNNHQPKSLVDDPKVLVDNRPNQVERSLNDDDPKMPINRLKK
jgi:hypothetical protein